MFILGKSYKQINYFKRISSKKITKIKSFVYKYNSSFTQLILNLNSIIIGNKCFSFEVVNKYLQILIINYAFTGSQDRSKCPNISKYVV